MVNRKLLSTVILIFLSPLAMAAPAVMDTNSVLGFIQQSMAPAISTLTSTAISWLGVFATLQFFITNYNLLKSDGDIQSVIAKMFGAVAWIGVCLFIINNGPQFIQSVGDQMFELLGLKLPGTASIFGVTVLASGGIFGAAFTIGIGSTTAGMVLGYLSLFVLAVGMFFAFKIFMLQLELGLIAMLAPLSFSFLGLGALKDQGIAPFKALLSLVYRIILLTVILSAFTKVSDVLTTTINSISASDLFSPLEVVKSLLSAIGSYVLLAYLMYKSDSIAASLASGSTSMGTGDVAQAAATGAALGAAVASGGAAAAGSGGKVPQAMSDFMGKMMGSGSISNASPMGSGGESTPSFTPPPPSLSAGGGNTQSPNTSNGTPGALNGKPPSRPHASAAAESQKTTSVASGRYGPGLPEGAQSSVSAGQPSSDGAKASSAFPETQGTPPPSTAQGAVSAEQPETTSPTDVQSEPVTVAPARSESAQSNPAQESSARPVDPAPGSGLSAEVGGKKSALESDLSKLVEHLSSQGPRKPSLGERLGEANRNVSQEQAATHISINTHHTD